MKIKNNERHKMNRGKLERVERDNNKIKHKNEIKKARKNKYEVHEFEMNQFQDYLDSQDIHSN